MESIDKIIEQVAIEAPLQCPIGFHDQLSQLKAAGDDFHAAYASYQCLIRIANEGQLTFYPALEELADVMEFWRRLQNRKSPPA